MFSILPEAEFQAEYEKAFEAVDVPTEADQERFRKAIFSTQQLIVEALQEKWTKVEDYEVGWDFNYCYHVCGGIYSDRISCPAYVQAIAGALAAAPSPERWTYHTVCEADHYDGEFFVRDGVVFISEIAEPELLEKLGARR